MSDQHNTSGNNVSGDGNTVAGGNQDNRRTSINTGNVSGGVVNIGGEMRVGGDMNVSYGGAGGDARQQLEAQIAELRRALDELRQSHPDDVEVVETLVGEAESEAKKPQPNKKLLEIKGNSLKQAAENLLSVAPIAVKIAKTLLMLA
jgi:hypothetical protein